jgi:acetyl/propionyl-CoA carboxylase alpha subunit
VKPSEETWGGEEVLCVTCKKADVKIGHIDTRDELIEAGTIKPITYGDWMKSHKLTLSEVYAKLAENGISVVIPDLYLALSETKKARRGRPGKSDDSVVDDDGEPIKPTEVKTKKPKATKKTEATEATEEPVKTKKTKATKTTEEATEATEEPVKTKKTKATKATEEATEATEEPVKTKKTKATKATEEATEATEEAKAAAKLAKKEAKAIAKAAEEKAEAKAIAKAAKKDKKSEDDLSACMSGLNVSELGFEECEEEKYIVDIDGTEWEQRGDLILTLEGVLAGRVVGDKCDWLEGYGTNL